MLINEKFVLIFLSFAACKFFSYLQIFYLLSTVFICEFSHHFCYVKKFYLITTLNRVVFLNLLHTKQTLSLSAAKTWLYFWENYIQMSLYRPVFAIVHPFQHLYRQTWPYLTTIHRSMSLYTPIFAILRPFLPQICSLLVQEEKGGRGDIVQNLKGKHFLLLLFM